MHNAPPSNKALVFTGNRSEFGLLSPLIELLSQNQFDVTVMIAGDHHSETQGFSRNEISFTGLTTFDLPYDASCTNNCSKIAFLISNINNYLIAHTFDYVVLYGDRYETFAAAICAHQHNIKIVHVEGGDITEGGVQDDSIRHAISKLATFHLPSNADSAKNLEQLGEEPWRIQNTGLTVNGYIRSKNYSPKVALVSKYALDHRTVILLTLHPLPFSAQETQTLVDECLKALQGLDPERFRVIITHPNSDPFNELIIDSYRGLSDPHIEVIPSLGRMDFHGLLALNQEGALNIVCAGNSSSGIKEAGFFQCVSVNIGDRQKSRLRSGIVVDCPPVCEAIQHAIEDVAARGFYKDEAAGFENPYLQSSSMQSVSQLLLMYSKNRDALRKKFYIPEK